MKRKKLTTFIVLIAFILVTCIPAYAAGTQVNFDPNSVNLQVSSETTSSTEFASARPIEYTVSMKQDDDTMYVTLNITPPTKIFGVPYTNYGTTYYFDISGPQISSGFSGFAMYGYPNIELSDGSAYAPKTFGNIGESSKTAKMTYQIPKSALAGKSITGFSNWSYDLRYANYFSEAGGTISINVNVAFKISSNAFPLSISDTTPPTSPTLTKIPNKEWHNDTVTVVATPGIDRAATGIKEVQYKLGSSGSWIKYTTPIEINSSTTVYARNLDNAGNISNQTSVVVNVDKTPPTPPTITKTPNSEWNNGAVSLSIASGTDGQSGVKESQYKIGTGGTWTKYTAPFSVNTTTNIYARTIDNVGHTSTESSSSVKIDQTEPTATHTFTPDTLTGSNVTITVTATDTESGIKRIKKPDGAYQDGSTTSYVVETNGEYNFELEDNVGNTSIYTVTIENIDNLPPTPPIIDANKTISNTEITFSITDGVDNESGVLKSQYQIQPQGTMPISSEWIDYSSSQTITDEGKYTVYAQTIDKAENPSPAASLDVEIDKTPPEEIVIDPDDLPNGGNSNEDIEITIPVNPDYTYHYQIVAADSPLGNTWQTITEGKFTVTQEGIWDVYIKVTDKAGNETISTPFRVMIDKTAPTEPVILTDKAISNTEINISINEGQDKLSGIKLTEYQITNNVTPASSTDWITYISPQTISEEGRYTIHARTVDNVDNISSIASLEVEIDKTPPEEIIIDPDDLPNGGNSNEDIEITVPINPDFSYHYQIVAADSPLGETWQPITDGKFNVTQEGIWDIYIKVTDRAGNETISNPIRIMIDKTAPTQPIIKTTKTTRTISNSAILITIEEGTDNLSGIDNTQYQIQEQGADPVDADWQEYTDFIRFELEGDYNVFARSIDRVGNISDVSSTGSDGNGGIIIDREPPNNPLISADKTIANDVITVTITGNDSDVQTSYRVDGSDWIVYTEPIKITDDGMHTVEAKNIDVAGNESNISSIEVEINRTQPEKPPVPDSDVSSNDKVEIPVETDPYLDYAYQVVEAEKPLKDSWKPITNEDHAIVVEDEGLWDAYLKVEDNIGNKNISDAMRIMIDKTAPSEPTIEIVEVDKYTKKLVIHDGIDALSGVKETRLTVNEQEKNLGRNRYRSTQEIVLDKAGTYTVTAVSEDNVGNISTATTTEIIIDQKPSEPSSGGGAGFTPPPSNQGEPSGGKDKDGNNLYLQNGIKVNKEALKQGYIGGYQDKTFRPNTNITRAEFAAMLNRIITIDATYTGNILKDVDSTHWAYKDIQSLQRKNIMNVTKENGFRPDEAITRAEIVFAITNVLDLKKYSSECELTDITKHEYKEQIAKAFNAGLTRGYQDNTFRPNNSLSRGEVVAMMNRVFGLDLEEIGTKKNVFKDVISSDWFYADVVKATKK